MRGQLLMKIRLMTIYNYPNLRNFNHVKKAFLVSFWYDVEFNEESFDGKHVSKLCWIQKLCTKNLQKW